MRPYFFIPALLMAFGTMAQAGYYPDKINERLVDRHPYDKVGRLDFYSAGEGYIGTGTIVTSRGVLTCAHNLYDANGGFSTRVRFTRARNGNKNKGRSTARRLYILADYPNHESESDIGFSRDLGAVHFPKSLGGTASVTLNPAKFFQRNQKEILGYGAEFHSGSYLLRARTRSRFFAYFSSFLGTNSFYTEAGMSGGPVFIRQNGKPRLYGVNVSSGGGTRALDQDYYPIYQFLRGQ